MTAVGLAPPRAGDPPALETIGLTKHFGPVEALAGIDLNLRHGEVLALLGDNGAGKTTLVRCLSGLHRPTAGTIRVEGRVVEIASPQDARDAGIETVHQGLALVGKLDVAANLFLNREIRRANPVLRALGWLDKKAMAAETARILDQLGVRVPSVSAPIERLSGGQRQAVAIGRAVGWGRRIVILDEPTAALGVEQSRHVNELILTLKTRGIAVLLISHNMQHVLETCDRAVVLRHGRKAGDVRVADVTARDLVDLITGAVRAAA